MALCLNLVLRKKDTQGNYSGAVNSTGNVGASNPKSCFATSDIAAHTPLRFKYILQCSVGDKN